MNGIIIPVLVVWGNSMLFPTVAAPVCIPTNSALGFPFLHNFTSTCFCRFVYDGRSHWCEVISHCGFNLHLSDGSWCWASFHMSLGPLYVLLGEVSVQVLCPFFNWTVCLPAVDSCEFLHILEIKPLSEVSLANIFSHIVSSLSILLMFSLAVQKLFNFI